MLQMKRQSTLFDNDVRVTPLEQKEIKSIRVKEDESKEFLTSSNRIVIVTKKVKAIQGVNLNKCTYFQINDMGKIIEPLQSVGVKNYLKRN